MFHREFTHPELYEYETDRHIPAESTVAEKQQQLKFHVPIKHTQAKVYGQKDGCQARQFTCLGEAPGWAIAYKACELCYNHWTLCLKKRPFVWCQGEMCQYDNDTDPWADNYKGRATCQKTEGDLDSAPMQGGVPGEAGHVHRQGGADLGAELDQAGPGTARDNVEQFRLTWNSGQDRVRQVWE